MNDAQMDAVKHTITAGLLSALGGGGLAYLANKAQKTDPEDLEQLNTYSPELVEIPYPIVKKNKPSKLLPIKTAEESEGIIPAAANFLLGGKAQHWSQVPWFPLAAVGGTAAAGIGAYSLIDKLMKNKRKQTMKDQLDEAEEDYKNTLLESYDPKKLQLTKTSKAKEINADLEKLAAMLKIADPTFFERQKHNIPGPSAPPDNSWFSKIPSPGNVLENLAGAAYGTVSGGLKKVVKPYLPTAEKHLGLAGIPAGLGLLAMGSIPIMSGVAAYNYFKKRNKSKLVNEAAKQRALERMAESIPAPYAAIEE